VTSKWTATQLATNLVQAEPSLPSSVPTACTEDNFALLHFT
jgi:hypothetical protein